MIVPGRIISEQDVARHYDELDRFYLDVWGEHIHHGLWISGNESAETAVRQLVDLVAVEAGIKADAKVCDVGAGYGAAARQIAIDYCANVTALTLSPAQHEYARRHAPASGNLQYILGDWLQNELPSEEYDAVYAIECASHMADPQRFVSEAARVLRPGGRLVVCAWVAAEQTSPRNVRHLLEPICREGRLTHLSTAREYVELLEEAGLDLSNFEDLSRRVRRTWPICLTRTIRRSFWKPQYIRYLMSRGATNRIFLITMLRIWLAYRAGVIRYILFRATKPSHHGGQTVEA